MICAILADGAWRQKFPMLSRELPTSKLLTDHLNSLTIIARSRSPTHLPHSWSSLNGRAYYRWLLDLLNKAPHLELQHVKAHTDAETVASKLNSDADQLAAEAHRSPDLVFPTPTFCMDKFSFYSPTHGFVEANIEVWGEQKLSSVQLNNIPPSSTRERLTAYGRYDPAVSSDYYIKRAQTSYSAQTQLQIRTSSLVTNSKLFKTKMTNDLYCQQPTCFGKVETESHIFVECPAYESLRKEASKELRDRTVAFLEKKDESEEMVRLAGEFASLLMENSKAWPAETSRYWLGFIPNPPSEMKGLNERSLAAAKKMWIDALIRTTARIYGQRSRFVGSLFKENQRVLEARTAAATSRQLRSLDDQPP